MKTAYEKPRMNPALRHVDAYANTLSLLVLEEEEREKIPAVSSMCQNAQPIRGF
jgi:hypothetical protein